METRYGAVRALSTLDSHDPAISGEKFEQGFTLRVVRAGGEPMVHVTRRKQAEVVVFGEDQQFQTPMTVSAGSRFMVQSDAGRNAMTISKFAPGRDVERRVVSPRVADVIRALAEMDANYSDILQMLTEAERQHNLPGAIGIDELPRPGRTYVRNQPQIAGDGEASGTQIQADDLAPNLFDDEFAVDDNQPAAVEDAELGPVGLMLE
jgi:hypothetical protein